MNTNRIYFLLNCFNAIESSDAKFFEFIYEKNGSFQLAEEFIQANIDDSKDDLLLNYEKFKEIATNDPLLITTIVKLSLSKINFNLITKHLLNTYSSLADANSISKTIFNLPVTNRLYLESLLKHLRRLLKYKKRNKMRMINYSIALNPFIFEPNSLLNKTIEDLVFHSKTIRLFHLLIQSFEDIFNDSFQLNKNSFDLQDNDDYNRNTVNNKQRDSDFGNSIYFKELLQIYNNQNKPNQTENKNNTKLNSKINYRIKVKEAKAKNTENFIIKSVLYKNEIENLHSNIEQYFIISPKFYYNYDTNDDKFIEIYRIVEKSDFKIPEIDISSLIK